MMKPLENLDAIRDVAHTVLRKADAGDRLPTPVDDILTSCGLLESDDYVLSESKIMQAPSNLRKLLRGAGRKIRGALDRKERIIHVSPSVEVPSQRQFVRCHEAMHDALPWQRDLMVLGDTSLTLAPDVEFVFEREANQGGAELLFQLDLLARVARDYLTDITTPVRLAGMFGASIHATFRRWIEDHHKPVCGLVLDPKPITTSPLTFRRFELVESESWQHQYGLNRFPRQLISSRYSFVGNLASEQLGQVDAHWGFTDRNGEMTTVRVQSFCNTYRTFVLIWPPTRESFIARHRARPQIQVARYAESM
jgi:hypothetical protein